MNNSEQSIINHLVKSTGMTPQQAAQVVQQLPQQLAKAGIDITKLPPNGLLQVIQETYGRIKSGKTAPIPPKPPMMTNK